MYPVTFLEWVAGTAILMGVIGIIGLLALWVDHAYQRHIEKHHGAPRDDEVGGRASDSATDPAAERPPLDGQEGRTGVWMVLEVLSAIFVVTGLLVAIYSDSAVLRAIAGIAMIVLVAATTWSVLDRQGD